MANIVRTSPNNTTPTAEMPDAPLAPDSLAESAKLDLANQSTRNAALSSGLIPVAFVTARRQYYALQSV